jgi:hypothetical protein
MWKKALWVYLWFYIAAIAGIILYSMVVDIQNGNFIPAALLLPLIMFVPAGVLYLGLKDRKVTTVQILFGLLITATPVVGMFNFDEFTLATIGKALFFVPMLVGLVYYGYIKISND